MPNDARSHRDVGLVIGEVLEIQPIGGTCSTYPRARTGKAPLAITSSSLAKISSQVQDLSNGLVIGQALAAASFVGVQHGPAALLDRHALSSALTPHLIPHPDTKAFIHVRGTAPVIAAMSGQM